MLLAGKCGKEALAVLVILEDAFSMVTTTHEVVNSAGILDAQLSRHCAEDNRQVVGSMSLNNMTDESRNEGWPELITLCLTDPFSFSFVKPDLTP